jgi:hypothetical protein
MDKGVLVAEWGQFQSWDLNHKPPKNNFLLFNQKTLTLNLINKSHNKMKVLQTRPSSFQVLKYKKLQKKPYTFHQMMKAMGIIKLRVLYKFFKSNF